MTLTCTGIILLDASGDNFPVIVDKIVDQLVESGQVKESEVDFVLQALYKKHRLYLLMFIILLFQ